MPESRATRSRATRSGASKRQRAEDRPAGDSTASTLEAAQISVGNFLRGTREALGLTQAQVADKTLGTPWRLSRAAVSAIERGQNFPGLEAMLALSNVLQIDPKELIERARLTAVVPVDISGLSDEELETRASQYFWAGDFKQALSVYDAMVQKLALEEREEASIATRLAELEVRRATALKRAGALFSAIATAERAISLSARIPHIQAEAYVVLADLQTQRGHLPLAGDAVERAIALAENGNRQILSWAFMVKGRLLYLAERFEEALEAFSVANRHADAANDIRHLTHITGNIGMCHLSLGRHAEAREWLTRAIELARRHKQPALEASWLVEQGKVALSEDQPELADRLASSALRVARPRDHQLTVFRAEWLRHRSSRATRA
jgi:tetratricopeptide (TPR) repeat protein